MAPRFTEPRVLPRDGTSQHGRGLDALSPHYVAVDERTPQDLLAFTRAHAETLRYWNEEDEPEGYFTAFLGSLSDDDIAAFLREPERFDPVRHPALFRPHFMLFMAFLRLFADAQAALNGLTRRHLDFYYRRFLRLAPRKATPDRVHLVFQAAVNASRVLVPAGSRANAGADAGGRDRIYEIGRDLLVTRARVERVSSLFVERRCIGVRESYRKHHRDGLPGLLEMLRIPLGDPLPGDALPPYPGGSALDETRLGELHALVKRCETELGLSPPALRELMERQAIVKDDASLAAKPAEWQKLDTIVLKAARRKRNEPEYNPGLSCESEADFDRNVREYLQLSAASPIPDLDSYWQDLSALEKHFCLPAERFAELMDLTLEIAGILDLGEGRGAIPPRYGDLVTSILTEAHRARTRAARRADLRTAHDERPEDGVTPLMQYALGDSVLDPPEQEDERRLLDEELRDRLLAFLEEADVARLQAAATAASPRWEEVFGVLEIALRVRLGEPPPVQVLWENLHPSSDARAVHSLRSAAEPGGPIPWSTFGARPPSTPGVAPAPAIGLLIASPVLFLAEGERTIRVTFGLLHGADTAQLESRLWDAGTTEATKETERRALLLNRALSPLRFEVSTAKGWLACNPKVTLKKAATDGDGETEWKVVSPYKELIAGSVWQQHDAAPGLQIELTLEPAAAPVAPLAGAAGGMDSPWPTLRIMLQPIRQGEEDSYTVDYGAFARLLLGAVHLEVEVKGLAALSLENDETTLNPKKPFEPFGSAPLAGSCLRIGHPEVVTKELDSLSFHFEWMGAPEDIDAHYKHYRATPGLASEIGVIVRSIDRAGARDIRGGDSDAPAAQLFGGGAITAVGLPMERDPEAALRGEHGERVSSWKRCLQWELTKGFFHKDYPAVAARKAHDLSVALANATTPDARMAIRPEDYQVNPPYTPRLKSLTLDYRSSVEILLDPAVPGDGLDRVHHVHPFGHCDVEAERTLAGVPFLPRYDAQSELLIGLRDVAPPENVTLLFQLAEGSEDERLSPPEVRWSALSGDRWLPLDEKIVLDETRGLKTSGILELSLGEVAPSTRMPGGLTWLRASIEGEKDALGDLIAIHTQAATAVFVDQGNAPEHHRAPLPGGTITRFATPIAGIMKAQQPYRSFGGRMAEEEELFATRVSERLRHKQRALSPWDYERIVLDRFPEVWKTKCIPATALEPGVVEVLVIPDCRDRPADALTPRATPGQLAAIREHLAERAPSCAVVRVRNASFRHVLVRLGVRLREQGNLAYSLARLNEDLRRFLSPWAYDGGKDIVIGGKIYSNSIVDFVDARPYVSFVAGIHLFFSDDEGETFQRAPLAPEGEGYCVEASGPDGVLVSYATHRFDVLDTELYDERLYSGIGFMDIELDFVVTPSGEGAIEP